MEVKINGNEIQIIGKQAGKYHWLKIWVNENEPGEDYFSLSTRDPSFETGNLIAVIMRKDDVIISDHGVKRFV